MSDETAKGAKDIARDELVSQVVGFAAYLTLTAVVSWAVLNRDMLWRAKRRAELAWRQRHADPWAREVAEFRREINDLSRGSSGPDTTRAPGLYERP